MYNRQRHSSIQRGHPLPDYSLEWFKERCLSNDKFELLYNEWVSSEYLKDLTPSVDRIDPRLGYRKDNIQLMTWGENSNKGIEDRKILKEERISKMKKNLIIFESPSKSRTVSSFLGYDYNLKASFGHIRDLDKKNMGFDINTFEPHYIISPDKRKIVSELKALIDKDTIVYLASDEDREGEAIAWHLFETLNLKKENVKRLVFHEITKPAILHALEHPREIDMNLVNAQQARRILDRGVGFTVSPLLWKKIAQGLSAGRVQSSAMKIIVDRERERNDFKIEEYYKIKVSLLNPSLLVELQYDSNKNILNKMNKEQAESIVKELSNQCSYVLTDIVGKDSIRVPQAPYTTSTLQQDAYNKIGFSVSNTMSVAQKLFEGNIKGTIPNHKGGLITYMRTDSVSLSDIALADIRKLVEKDYGPEYYNFKKYKTKSAGAQEAHEAIRPVDVNLKPDDVKPYLDEYAYKLYKLIWNQTVASQMSIAKVSTTTYTVTATTALNNKYLLNAKGVKIIFPGFLKVIGENNKEVVLPSVEKFHTFKFDSLENIQLFTKPPARYSEATLVKKLEDEGIGRPSTYSSTISTIISRSYVIKDTDKRLEPTNTGITVTEFLEEHFPEIVDAHFTANVEAEFDKIAAGNSNLVDILKEVFLPIKAKVDAKIGKEGAERMNIKSSKRILGEYKGKDVAVNIGRFGPYIQYGLADKDKGIKADYFNLTKDKFSSITLEEAIVIIDTPKEKKEVKIIGKFNNEDITYRVGRFGPYITAAGKFYPVSKTIEVSELTEEVALEIIKNYKPNFQKKKGK